MLRAERARLLRAATNGHGAPPANLIQRYDFFVVGVQIASRMVAGQPCPCIPMPGGEMQVMGVPDFTVHEQEYRAALIEKYGEDRAAWPALDVDKLMLVGLLGEFQRREADVRARITAHYAAAAQEPPDPMDQLPEAPEAP